MIWGRIRFRALIVSLALVIMALCRQPAWALMESVDYPNTRFAVVSDLHYYDPSLGTRGKAFEEYLGNDRKLLRESRELLNAAITAIAQSDAQFVLIPGDLTKDGELVNHRYVSAALRRLQNAGKKVFVVPGNHDILNPDAAKFVGDGKEPATTVTPADFAKIYAPYGYGTALKRDPASLSYVAEPVNGLRLIALDACRYDENAEKGTPIVGGRLKPETMTWLESVLKDAKASGKATMAMMHHGVLQHFSGQKGKFKDYIVADGTRIAELLAKNGCRMVFTGHFHAQDITTSVVAGGGFHDVETGSLVTYPNPWRTVELMSNMARISSSCITSIPSRRDLASYSKAFAMQGIREQATKSLKKYRVRQAAINILAPQIAERFMLHYQGDEPRGMKGLKTKGLDLWAKIVALVNHRLMKGLVTDRTPEDLNVFLSL